MQQCCCKWCTASFYDQRRLPQSLSIIQQQILRSNNSNSRMSLVFLLVPLHLEQWMFKYFVLLKLLHLLIGWNSYYIMFMWLQFPPWLVQARNIDWSDTRNMRGTMASILPNHKRTSTWVQRICFIYDGILAGSSTAPASNLLLLELLLRTESILSLATSTSSWLCNHHHLVSTTKSDGLSSCEVRVTLT